MKYRFVLAKTAAFLAAISFAAAVSAQTERPVIIAYTAPPECASLEAFQGLLESENRSLAEPESAVALFGPNSTRGGRL